MAVVQLSQWRINPGRGQEFFQNVAKAKAIHERLGASVRVYQSTLARPNANTVSYVQEFADATAHGAFTDKLNADAEWQAFVQGVLGGADPSGALLSNSLATEVAV